MKLYVQLLTIAIIGCIANEERKVVEYVLSQNKERVRPVANFDDKLVVNLGVKFQDIVSFDRYNGDLKLNIWSTLGWNDFYLQWKPSDFSGVKKAVLSSNDIWIPDIKLYNGLFTESQKDVPIIVQHDGSVIYVPPSLVGTRCSTKQKYNRMFSTQWKCSIKFGSWVYHAGEVDLRDTNAGVTNIPVAVSNDDWKIADVTSERNVVRYPCCVEEYVDITYNFTLVRT